MLQIHTHLIYKNSAVHCFENWEFLASKLNR